MSKENIKFYVVYELTKNGYTFEEIEDIYLKEIYLRNEGYIAAISMVILNKYIKGV